MAAAMPRMSPLEACSYKDLNSSVLLVYCYLVNFMLVSLFMMTLCYAIVIITYYELLLLSLMVDKNIYSIYCVAILVGGIFLLLSL